MTLGVDVINMSLGSDAGFSTSTEEQFQKIYDSVKSHGVILNVAAGNAYSSALGNEAGTICLLSPIPTAPCLPPQRRKIPLWRWPV